MSGGCLENVLRMSGRSEGVWKVSGMCLEGVWRVSKGHLEGIGKVSGRCLEDIRGFMQILCKSHTISCKSHANRMQIIHKSSANQISRKYHANIMQISCKSQEDLRKISGKSQANHKEYLRNFRPISSKS